MAKIILDVGDAVRVLRRAIARMTIAEVDLIEICSVIIAALQEKQCMDKRYNEFCSAYATYGSTSGAPTNDGTILVEAWQQLFRAVLNQYTRLGLWDEHGCCSYVLESIQMDTLIIADPYRLDAMSDEEYKQRMESGEITKGEISSPDR